MTRLLPFLLPFLLLAAPAQAYIGPGAGLGAIGLTIALVLGALLLIVGFVWYPLKRLLRSSKKTPDAAAPDQDG